MLGALLSGQMVESNAGRYTVEGVNENRMAMIYEQLSVVTLFSFFYFKDGLYRLISLFSFLCALLLLLLSGSRSAMLVGIMGAFTIVFCVEFFSGKSKKRLLPLIFLFATLFVGVNWLLDLDLPVLKDLK